MRCSAYLEEMVWRRGGTDESEQGDGSWLGDSWESSPSSMPTPMILIVRRGGYDKIEAWVQKGALREREKPSFGQPTCIVGVGPLSRRRTTSGDPWDLVGLNSRAGERRTPTATSGMRQMTTTEEAAPACRPAGLSPSPGLPDPSLFRFCSCDRQVGGQMCCTVDLYFSEEGERLTEASARTNPLETLSSNSALELQKTSKQTSTGTKDSKNNSPPSNRKPPIPATKSDPATLHSARLTTLHPAT